MPAMLLSRKPVSLAGFQVTISSRIWLTAKGFSAAATAGPRRLLPGTLKHPRLEYVKRMRRNSRREDHRAWAEVEIA
jgi:hypothetical protein